MMLTKRQIDDIKYFHQEKGDIERYCHWEDIKKDVGEVYPELIQAIVSLDMAHRVLDRIVDDLEPYND